MATPRDHSIDIGGATKMAAPPKVEIPEPQRGKDPVLTQNQRERLLLDVKPPRPVPKPFR